MRRMIAGNVTFKFGAGVQGGLTMSQNKSSNDWSRRNFLRAMGLGSAGGALILSGCGDTDIINAVDIEVRKERVEPQVDPQDFVRPGIEMYYASTCRQCPAGCGIHARIRQGRVLKLEGNPASPVNAGRLCPMGQAGLQGHYNPDRLTKPMLRKGGKLVEVSWDEAMDALIKRMGKKKSSRIAWLNGAVSGHQRALIESYLVAAGSAGNLFVFDTLPPSVGHAVNESMLGHAMPKFNFERASLIMSFGADFLGTWMSPVHFAREYARFRDAPRGTLIQIESKMTLTGANADRWIAVRPGSEQMLAMALGSIIVNELETLPEISNPLVQVLADVDMTEATRITGVDSRTMHKLARLLIRHSPSLILSGASAEGSENGYQTATAVHVLNYILGNVGKTIEPRAKDVFPQLTPRMGGWKELSNFTDGVKSGRFDTVVTYGTNPVYQAPDFMKMDAVFKKTPYHVAFAQFPDETSLMADIVIPVHSYLEEWGTDMPAYAAEDGQLSLQQPVMNPVFGDAGTRSFGEVLLGLLKRLDKKYKRWNSHSDYIREAMWNMRGAIVNAPKPELPGQTEEDAYWQGILSQGLVRVKAAKAKSIKVHLPDTIKSPPVTKEDATYPYHMVPAARLGLWDGRHANLPWLQELPDQLAEVVWDSWVEIHPKTAEKLDVETGDLVKVTSSQGSLEVKVLVFPGIHPEVVAIPMGQGHTEYGRYAKGRGVNPYKILAPKFDKETGELASHGTRVSVTKVADRGPIVTLAHGDLVLESNTSIQAGRELVKTVTAKQFNRTEEEA